MKRYLSFTFVILTLLALVLSACGQAATEAPAEEAPADDVTKVAAVFPGVVTDQSWNQFGYEGLVKAEEECGVEIAYSEDVSQDEQLEVFRNYAAEGYDIIIAHGGEYADSLDTVAKEFPDLYFGLTSGEATTPNMSATILSYRQMAYLAGVLACKMTETNHVAYVLGEILPTGDHGVEGWELGVATCGKDTKATSLALGSWSDVAKAREAGLTLIDDGADVLYHLLDTADAGLISAADDEGVWAIGLYRDSTSLGPNAIIGSTLGSPGAMIYELACEHVEPGKTVPIYVNTPGGVGVSMHFTDLTPDDIQQEVLEVFEQLKSGELDIGLEVEP
jgi:basic membrane protein A